MEYVLAAVSSPNFIVHKAGRAFRAGFSHIADHFIPHHRNHYHPHILGHRALALFSALLVTAKIFTLAILAFGPVLPALSSAITSENIINLTNRSRQEYKLKPLSPNGTLAKAAQAKANDMLARSYFSHNTPDGKTPWSFISAAGYNYLMAGENLAVNFTEAENVDEAWMNSPGHKANILNKNFEEIGIGIAQGEYQGHTAIFVVQLFGTPAEQKMQVSHEPTQVQTSDVPAPVKPPPAAVAASGIKKPQPIQAPPPAEPAQPAEAVKIFETRVDVLGNQAEVEVQTNSTATRVVAVYGGRAIMLDPKNDNLWRGSVSLEKVAAAGASLKVFAYDINDRSDAKLAGEFAGSTVTNYNVLGANAQARVQAFGLSLDIKSMEQKFYLLFLAGLLSSLVLAIAIKRHIQHVSLVANTSFVATLACLLLLFS